MADTKKDGKDDKDKITKDVHRKWNRRILVAALFFLALGVIWGLMGGASGSGGFYETSAVAPAPACNPQRLPRGWSSEINLLEVRCLEAELSSGPGATPIKVKIRSNLRVRANGRKNGTRGVCVRWNGLGEYACYSMGQYLPIDQSGYLEAIGEGTLSLEVLEAL